MKFKDLTNNPEDGNILKIIMENRMKQVRKEIYPTAEEIVGELI